MAKVASALRVSWGSPSQEDPSLNKEESVGYNKPNLPFQGPSTGPSEGGGWEPHESWTRHKKGAPYRQKAIITICCDIWPEGHGHLLRYVFIPKLAGAASMA